MTTVNPDAGNTTGQVNGPGTSAPTNPAVLGVMGGMTISPSTAPPTSDVSVAAPPPVFSMPPATSSIAVAAPTASHALHVGPVSISLAWIVAMVAALLVAAICSAAVFAASRIAWRRFALRYPVERPMAGAAFDASLVRFSHPLRSYRDGVRITLGERGLHFSAIRKDRWSQPDFTVPWTSVAAVLRRRAPGGPRYRIVIDDAAGRILVKLRADLSDIVHAYWKLGDSSTVLDHVGEVRPRNRTLVRLQPELRDSHARLVRRRRSGRATRRRTVRA
jgi:hypothetical protein